MNDTEFKLARAPIVEAVLDVNCDMPPGFDLPPMEGACRARFHDQYPLFKTQLFEEHKIEQKPDAPPQLSMRHGIQSFQFLHPDRRQLVQVRHSGFSFNRLAPYTSLDEYLPEIERTWRLFVELAAPVQIRAIQLRYINRIVLPPTEGRIELDDYLKIAPRLPDEKTLTFTGFLNHHTVQETGTGNQANIVLCTQPPVNDQFPIIFDIMAITTGNEEPKNWPWIYQKILSLRGLKNRIFWNTLTERCLNLFQQP